MPIFGCLGFFFLSLVGLCGSINLEHNFFSCKRTLFTGFAHFSTGVFYTGSRLQHYSLFAPQVAGGFGIIQNN